MRTLTKLLSRWRPDFPVELFWCGIRQEARRLYLPLTAALSLVLSMLVLMGTYFAIMPFGAVGMGGRLLPAITFSVTLGLFIVLGMSVPFALRSATAEDDLPLMMLTGHSPLSLWRARVWSTAFPALLVPMLHIPLLIFIFTMGGVRFSHVGAVGVFWLAAWLTITGWSALGGCLWSGMARERMQGMSLTLILVFIYGVGWIILGRILYLMRSPWVWWTVSSFQPPWTWTVPEFARLGAHVAFGLIAGSASVVVLRGRWRSATEAGSKEGEHTLAKPPAVSIEQPQFNMTAAVPTYERRQLAPYRPRCGNDPWFWKDFHISGGSWLFWQCRLGVAVVLSIVALAFVIYSLQYRAVEPVIFITMLGWFIWIMIDVSQILAVEFQDRMWSIVRITPSTVGQILRSKLVAFAARFAPSLLPLGVICALGLMTYAWEMIIYGLPVLLLISVPFSTLVMYGTAIPQNLIGGGWPMLRTLGVFAVMIAGYITTLILLDTAMSRGPQTYLLHWAMSVTLSVVSTLWFGYATVCELNDPRRERLSADGG